MPNHPNPISQSNNGQPYSDFKETIPSRYYQLTKGMENTYEELRKNPTCKIERELNNSLKKVEEKDLSTDKQDDPNTPCLLYTSDAADE